MAEAGEVVVGDGQGQFADAIVDAVAGSEERGKFK